MFTPSVPANCPIVVSVVVPVYNVALYLDQCLESLLHQGFASGELEVILVNDGSTDGSNLIAELWARKHSNFHLVHQENQGLSAARNTGLDLARGKYLIFLDSDDIVPDQVYSHMVSMLERSGSDFVTAPAYRFSTHARNPWPFNRTIDLYSSTRVAVTFEDYPEFIRDFTAWNKMYRREFFVQSGVRFPEGRIYEDVATSPLLYLKARTFDVLSMPGYYWRITPGSITQTITPVKALDRLWALNQVSQHVLRHTVSERLMRELEFAIVDYNLRWIFQDFPHFDAEAQSEILQRGTELLEPFLFENLEQVEEKLAEQARLLRQGQHEDLRSLLPDSSAKKPPAAPRSKKKRLKKKELRKQQTTEARENRNRRKQHLFLYLLFRPFMFALPLLKRHIVVSSYWGTKFSKAEGPAAVALKVTEVAPEYTVVIFVASHARKTLEPRINRLLSSDARYKIVENGTLGYYFYLWRAKYLFNDVNFFVGFAHDKFVGLRRGQIEVQTTHGVPLKKMGLDSEDAIQPSDVRKFLAKSSRYTHLISTSPTVAETFASSHGVAPVVLPTGLPQNDELFEPITDDERFFTLKKYGLNPRKRTILYAPTYRHGQGYAFRYLLDVELLEETLGEDYQLAIKPHPYNHTHLPRLHFRELTNHALLPTTEPFVHFFGEVRQEESYVPVIGQRREHAEASQTKRRFNHHADINELMRVCDVFVTDYSSTIFSYMHLNKPCIVFTPDSEFYETTRGNYYSIDDIAPGSVTKTTEEVIEAVKLSAKPEAWQKQYGQRIEKFKEQFLLWEQGNATSRVLQEVGIRLQV